MEKNRNLSAWTEAGYELFAHEGLDGLQVERLARILQLNKSGFYHYFGDLEGFCAQLLNLHKKKVNVFVEGLTEITTLDPGYLFHLINHAATVMFQVQLVRNPNNNFLYAASEMADEKVNAAIRALWCEYFNLPVDTELGIRYYMIVRDVFYTRVSFQNLNYTFLHNLITDVKAILDESAIVNHSDLTDLEIPS
ncbi:MAG TPA: TetR/AcrR family transcriptional regulator [Chryseolinea sp.]